jgi:hypothetical protein
VSAQINLYHPRFLKPRELLTLRNVALAAAALYSLLAVAGGWAWQNAAAQGKAAAAAEAQAKSARDAVEAATTAAAIRKPSPQLAAELENARRPYCVAATRSRACWKAVRSAVPPAFPSTCAALPA